MKTTVLKTPAGYRIGAVARLTGISPVTLRIWERRYQLIEPARSSGGGRLYSQEDVARLTLIRQLLDQGDAIGSVADLDLQELQERLAGMHAVALPAMVAGNGPCRLLVVGEQLSRRLQAEGDALQGMTLAAGYSGFAAFSASPTFAEADVIVIELPTLHADTTTRIIDCLMRSKASHAIVIYRFATREALRSLPSSRCTAMRAPVEPLTLRHYCLSLFQAAGTEDNASPQIPAEDRPAPVCRYTDADLARLANISVTVQCECPRHLAELLSALTAFERYSSECENRSPDDAALHAYLGTSASHARGLIEDALARVIKTEGIEL